MKLNVKNVQAEEAARLAKVKPAPVVRVVAKINPLKSVAVQPEVVQAEIGAALSEKDLLIKELETKQWRLLKDRAILSSQNHKLIAECDAKLRKESAAVADEFLKGNVPMPELAMHWSKMNALTEEASDVFDQIEHLKLYNKLPEKKPAINIDADQTDNVKLLLYEVRRLDDMISKTNKKLESYKPKNIERISMWKEKVALAEAKRDELKHKIKTLQYEARAKRQQQNIQS